MYGTLTAKPRRFRKGGGHVCAAADRNSTVVIDRFHVACQYRAAVDDRRIQEVRRLSKELPKERQDDLKHTLWPFRKRPADRLNRGVFEK